jgi:hypothetical protein
MRTGQDITRTMPPISSEDILTELSSSIQDPRVRLALNCCKDLIGEPPLGLAQIQEAIGVFRPKGRPCFRTIQRWAEEKGMPCSFDYSNNQRVYFLSKVLSWYQQAFPYTDVAEETATRSRQNILRMALGRTRLHARVG